MANERFRFRAWDTEYNRMTQPYASWPKGELLVNGGYKDLILMQCTGLRDSEGTLIWEGDVIEIVEDEDKGSIYSIRWCTPGGGFEFSLPDGTEVHQHFTRYDAEGLKVIGNIYEHSHLLEIGGKG